MPTPGARPTLEPTQKHYGPFGTFRQEAVSYETVFYRSYMPIHLFLYYCSL